MRIQLIPLIVLLGLSPALPAIAAGPTASEMDKQVLAVPGFLDAHPDMMYRQWGVAALRRNELQTAITHFQRAARYADKPAQGYLAELYWYGVQMPADPVRAYAWISVAAERSYPLFVQLREQFGAGLSPDQRAQAQQLEQQLLAEYGDAVAKPRIAEVLRRNLQNLTGSRTGSQASNMDISYNDGSGAPRTIKGSQYYNARYWDPVQYHRWQDATWEKVPVSTVDVGKPQSLPTSPQESVLPLTRPPSGDTTP